MFILASYNIKLRLFVHALLMHRMFWRYRDLSTHTSWQLAIWEETYHMVLTSRRRCMHNAWTSAASMNHPTNASGTPLVYIVYSVWSRSSRVSPCHFHYEPVL